MLIGQIRRQRGVTRRRVSPDNDGSNKRREPSEEKIMKYVETREKAGNGVQRDCGRVLIGFSDWIIAAARLQRTSQRCELEE